MDDFYSPESRALQDRFDTRRLADRLVEVKVHHRFTEDDRAFVERLDMFFLATVDANGHPTCSYEGGEPGFVRVLDERTLAFPGGDPLLPAYPEAQFVVRVRARRIYPNCPRYIHRYQLVERSPFVPRSGLPTPVPAWKQADWAADVLPAGDPARELRAEDREGTLPQRTGSVGTASPLMTKAHEEP